jgi:hypothetical protein
VIARGWCTGVRLVHIGLCALVSGVVILSAACGGGGEDPTRPTDPLSIARWIGEGRVICDLEHAQRGEGLDAGWTAYAPPAPVSGLQAARAARSRLENCRENVEPGTRVTATLESSKQGRAVVVLRTIAPSGGGTTERMRFTRSGGSWLRVG